MLPFPRTAVSAVRRSFPAARLDCGVTFEGGSLTLTKEAPPFRREERRARSEHRLDRRRVCEIGRHGMPLTEAGDRIDRRLGSFAIRPVVDDDTRAGLGKPDGDRPPDAARRPCHQCGPPLQVDGHHRKGQATSYGPASSSAGCQSTC